MATKLSDLNLNNKTAAIAGAAATAAAAGLGGVALLPAAAIGGVAAGLGWLAGADPNKIKEYVFSNIGNIGRHQTKTPEQLKALPINDIVKESNYVRNHWNGASDEERLKLVGYAKSVLEASQSKIPQYGASTPEHESLAQVESGMTQYINAHQQAAEQLIAKAQRSIQKSNAGYSVASSSRGDIPLSSISSNLSSASFLSAIGSNASSTFNSALRSAREDAALRSALGSSSSAGTSRLPTTSVIEDSFNGVYKHFSEVIDTMDAAYPRSAEKARQALETAKFVRRNPEKLEIAINKVNDIVDAVYDMQIKGESETGVAVSKSTQRAAKKALRNASSDERFSHRLPKVPAPPVIPAGVPLASTIPELQQQYNLLHSVIEQDKVVKAAEQEAALKPSKDFFSTGTVSIVVLTVAAIVSTFTLVAITRASKFSDNIKKAQTVAVAIFAVIIACAFLGIAKNGYEMYEAKTNKKNIVYG